MHNTLLSFQSELRRHKCTSDIHYGTLKFDFQSQISKVEYITTRYPFLGMETHYLTKRVVGGSGEYVFFRTLAHKLIY